MKKLILFDIDGTLLLTGGAGKRAFNRVFFELFRIEGAWQGIHPDGRTDPSLIRELFEKNLGRAPRGDEMPRIIQTYTHAMGEALHEAENFRLMPGVHELLTELRSRDFGLLGLATGNFEATAYQKLARADLREFFSFGGFASDHPDRLQLTRIAVERGRQALGRWLDPEEIFLVGDTVHDIRCAQCLSLTTVAVATGSTPREVLAAARPDFLFDDLKGLEEILLLFH